MKYQILLKESTVLLEKNPKEVHKIFRLNLFEKGAKWMCDWMHILEPDANMVFDAKIAFNAYGFFKYALCLLFFMWSATFFYQIQPLFMPFSVFVFYLVEVHFLFLFPLLIDKVENPLWQSFKETYRQGPLYLALNVLPIGVFMVWGLLNLKNPWRNWHIGCLAILIWYQDEFRNRL